MSALASAAAGKETVNLPCEVCGGTRSTPWLRLHYPQYQHPGSFDLRRCDGCALVFNSPRLVDEALAKLYERNYYLFAEAEAAAYARVSHLHQDTVARLEALAPRGRILEVGSAKGYMLSLLRDRGWDAQGVELSTHASRFATERLQVPTFTGTLEHYVEQPALQPFSVAYSTDVIEHVPSPRRFLEAMRRALVPGGLLLIGTPNVAADGIDEFGPHWLGFNPFHIWLFSRDTLARLLDRCGFDLVEAWTFGNLQPQREPQLPVWRRLTRDSLARLGWLGAARALRQHLAGAEPAAALEAHRRAAGARLDAAQPFAQTADGQHPRALACRGDNLVIVARRRADRGAR